MEIGEVAAQFFKLGCVGFGGPTAHVAMMEEQCVKQRAWVTQEQFTEGLALCSLLPGPTSTQMAIWLGYRRAGLWGGLCGGLCFILPAFVLLMGLTWAYFRYGALPDVQGMFRGIGPAVIAIILATCLRLGKTAVKGWPDALLLLLALLLTVSGIEVALTLLGAGLLGMLRAKFLPPAAKPPNAEEQGRGKREERGENKEGISTGTGGTEAPNSDKIENQKSKIENPPVPGLAPLVLLLADGRLLRLALFFLKVGALLFGGGFVIIPFLRHEVVDVQHWMTAREFLDGVALGQVTPGPVVITATFIGYKAAGWSGALTATAAIFLPSFVFVLLAAPSLARVRKFPSVQAFLKGVSPAVVGAILATCLPLARTIRESTPAALWFPLLVFAFALTALTRSKIGTPWVVIAAGLTGILFSRLRG